MKITRFQINGRGAAAVTDSTDLFCTLCVEGPAAEFCICLYHNDTLDPLF